jgi:hypothetical protein
MRLKKIEFLPDDVMKETHHSKLINHAKNNLPVAC